jgi:HEAT repeat protein
LGRLRRVLVRQPEQLLDNLRQCVYLQDDEECDAVAHAIAAASEALSLAQTLLMATDANERWWAVRCLAASGRSDAVPSLVQALGDPDDTVRCAAALALGQLRCTAAIPELVSSLSDDSGWVRKFAADGLALIGEAAVPALAEALEDDRVGVRVRAAYALGKVRSMQAATPLFRALNDSSHLVHTYAYQALDDMGLLDTLLLV